MGVLRFRGLNNGVNIRGFLFETQKLPIFS